MCIRGRRAPAGPGDAGGPAIAEGPVERERDVPGFALAAVGDPVDVGEGGHAAAAVGVGLRERRAGGIVWRLAPIHN